jgi:hypothetical protein
MTGSQQSGDGGNPEFDVPEDKKSVGGAAKAKGPVTATPGRDYLEKDRSRDAAGGDRPRNEDTESRGDPRSLQQDDDESAGIEARSATGGRYHRRAEESPEPGNGHPAAQRSGGANPRRTGQQRAGQHRTGQKRVDTGTPGSSDQATPDEEGVIFDENKAAK